ncbi:MAG: hypothetical protein OEW69_11530, partial [Nitrospirota bacterium]|nr:hypothetical protein [Nitrospirota bacterium]
KKIGKKGTVFFFGGFFGESSRWALQPSLRGFFLSISPSPVQNRRDSFRIEYSVLLFAAFLKTLTIYLKPRNHSK